MAKVIIPSKLDCIENFEDFNSNNEYYGILPDLDLENYDNLIKTISNCHATIRHPYADIRLESLAYDHSNKVQKFLIEYNFTQSFVDDFYNFIFSRFIFNDVLREILKIESEIRLEIQYLSERQNILISLEQRTKNILNIYSKNEESSLIFSLLNGEYRDPVYEGFSEFDCLKELSSSPSFSDRFSYWYLMYLKYLKGEVISKQDIIGLNDFKGYKLSKLEIQLYSEISKLVKTALIKEGYTSVSLSKQDQEFLESISAITTKLEYVYIIGNILESCSSRNISFFSQLFNYLKNNKRIKNFFKDVRPKEYILIMQKHYPDLNFSRVVTQNTTVALIYYFENAIDNFLKNK